jgi:hypothetical protein
LIDQSFGNPLRISAFAIRLAYRCWALAFSAHHDKDGQRQNIREHKHELMGHGQPGRLSPELESVRATENQTSYERADGVPTREYHGRERYKPASCNHLILEKVELSER